MDTYSMRQSTIPPIHPEWMGLAEEKKFFLCKPG